MFCFILSQSVTIRNGLNAESSLFVYFQHGEIWLEVVFVAPDEDSDDENHEYEDENGFRQVLVILKKTG